MNTTLAVLSLTALLAPVLSQAAEAPISAKQYQNVLAGSWRDPANSARDGYRHPSPPCRPQAAVLTHAHPKKT